MPQFLWYDLETSGLDPRADRILQFACQATDAGLQPVAEPVSLLCRLPDDVLPDVGATLVTGITPAQLMREGLGEIDFAERLHALFSAPGQCVAGYNVIRFDDEFVRHLLFRNLRDPYAREWQHGNSRFDLIDVLRIARALRPEGIVWPQEAHGPSLRLEHLAPANGIEHAAAHEAGADVSATISMARCVRGAQPRLWEHCWRLRTKRGVNALLDRHSGEALVLVSGTIAVARDNLGVVVPVGPRPERPNELVVVDVREDPSGLDGLDLQTLRTGLFARGDGAPAWRKRLRTVHLNRQPALAPLTVLRPQDLDRLDIDPDEIERRRNWVQGRTAMHPLWLDAFGGEAPVADDVEASIYDGFLPDGDRDRLGAFHREPLPARLTDPRWRFEDERLNRLRFRLLARHFPECLSPAEAARWDGFVAQRLRDGHGSKPPLETWLQAVDAALETGDERDRALARALRTHGETLARRYGLDGTPTP